MKKENEEMRIITQELEVIIPPNDQLSEQMGDIFGGSGQPGCTLCIGQCNCKKSSSNYTPPPGNPGQQ